MHATEHISFFLKLAKRKYLENDCEGRNCNSRTHLIFNNNNKSIIKIIISNILKQDAALNAVSARWHIALCTVMS